MTYASLLSVTPLRTLTLLEPMTVGFKEPCSASLGNFIPGTSTAKPHDHITEGNAKDTFFYSSNTTLDLI